MQKELIKIEQNEIMEMEQRYRATFINSLTGFKAVALLGTIDSSGNENLAIFNSLVHLGAHPPLIGMIVRPDSVARHTLENILETGHYTINHIRETMVSKAHQTAARYPKEVSEFDVVGLKAQYVNDFSAPFVEEAYVKMGMKFREKVELTINGTILVIGEIQQVYLPHDAMQDDGFVDLVEAGTITNTGLDSYHTVTKGTRYPYAKP
jgi:flavin reductase (DIM6/NTAB) family NADH-FMN oxidoreductase RutF